MLAADHQPYNLAKKIMAVLQKLQVGESIRIYMLGGVDVLQGEVSPLDQIWLADLNSKPICIVDLTVNDPSIRSSCKTVLNSHFANLTDSELIFISEEESRNEVLNALRTSGVIYIPGGDTEVLLDNLAKLDLFNTLRSSKVPIVGSSAGALALCKEVVLTKDESITTSVVLTGLGLVNFSIDPHYDSTHDEELFELSKGREIYGIPEPSGIIVEDSVIEFVGSVWRFADGCKERVH